MTEQSNWGKSEEASQMATLAKKLARAGMSDLDTAMANVRSRLAKRAGFSDARMARVEKMIDTDRWRYATAGYCAVLKHHLDDFILGASNEHFVQATVRNGYGAVGVSLAPRGSHFVWPTLSESIQANISDGAIVLAHKGSVWLFKPLKLEEWTAGIAWLDMADVVAVAMDGEL